MRGLHRFLSFEVSFAFLKQSCQERTTFGDEVCSENICFTSWVGQYWKWPRRCESCIVYLHFDFPLLLRGGIRRKKTERRLWPGESRFWFLFYIFQCMYTKINMNKILFVLNECCSWNTVLFSKRKCVFSSFPSSFLCLSSFAGILISFPFEQNENVLLSIVFLYDKYLWIIFHFAWNTNGVVTIIILFYYWCFHV